MRNHRGGWLHWRSVLLFLLAIICVACARHSTATSSGSGSTVSVMTGDSSGSLVVNDVPRTYVLHVPASYTGQAAVPLVIVVHGGGGTGQGMVRLTHMSAVADSNGFIVVYPDGLNHHWNDGRQIANDTADDVGFIAALIDSLATIYHIDRRRVYAAGISNGGMFTQRLGCELANKLAAIAPDAGLMPVPEDAICHPAHPMPILEFHGDSDPIVPFTGGVPRCDPGLSSCGTLLSADATLAHWATRDGCQASYASVNLPDVTGHDGPAPSFDSTVEQRTYQRCPADMAVVFDVIHGGGHTWPGGEQYFSTALVGWTNRDIDASQFMWRFFAAYTLPGA